jgi:predicted transcriptional regulator
MNTGSGFDLVSFVTRSKNRVAALGSLATEPATRPEIQARTGVPRATLSRILADFERRGLARREGHRFELTPLGDLLASELDALFDAVEAMETFGELGRWLALDELDPPLDRLSEAAVVVPSGPDPLAPVRRAESLLADASRVRLVAENVVPGCLEAVASAVAAGEQTVDCVFTADAVAVIGADEAMRQWTRELLAAEGAALFVHEGPLPNALFVVDDTTFLAVTDGDGTIRGHVESEDRAVREWAEATVDAYVAAADPFGDHEGVLTA